MINNEKIIYEKVENGNGIRITETTSKGKTYLDIRKFYTKDGELLPTRKGIMFSVTQWEELIPIIIENLKKINN